MVIRNIKKRLYLLIVVISALSILAASVYAFESVLTDEDLAYILSTGDMEYKDSAYYTYLQERIDEGVFVIPDTVTKICYNSFSYFQIGEIRIPASVKEIEYGAFCGLYLCDSLIVDPDNQYYTVIDNSLVSKDGKEMLFYQSDGICDENFNYTYRLPEGVETLCPYSVVGYYDYTSLIDMYLPSTLKTISTNAFEELGATLLSIPSGVDTVEPGVLSFSDVENIVFSACPTNMNADFLIDEYSKVTIFDKIYFMYDERQDLYYERISDDAAEYMPQLQSFIECVQQGKYEEALAIQNLDGKHPSAEGASTGSAIEDDPGLSSQISSGAIADSDSEEQASSSGAIQTGESGTETDPVATQGADNSLYIAAVCAALACVIIAVSRLKGKNAD